MKITVKSIMGVDVYFILMLNRKINIEEARGIIDCVRGWCLVVTSGVFNGPLHSYTEPEYNEEHQCVLFEADLGSMDIEQGINLLKGICEGCNKYMFREELIVEIGITSEPEF